MIKSISQIILLSLFSVSVAGQWESEVDSLKKKLNPDMPDSSKIELHKEIVNLYFRNNPSEVYSHLEELRTLAKNTSDTTLLFNTYCSLSDYYSIMNDYLASLEMLSDALELAGSDKSKQAFCHSKLSETYYFSYDLEQSIYHARKALSLNTDTKDTMQITYDYHNIAMWHVEKNLFDSALYYLRKAQGLYAFMKQEPAPIIYSHLGETFSQMNQFDSAIYYHNKAYRIDSLNQSEYEMAIDKNYLADTYFRSKNYNKAIEYAGKSLKMAIELNLLDVVIYNYELLFKTYQEKGNYKQALEYSILRNDYADSLREKNKESFIQAYKAQYRYNEQQQTLETQAAENKLLRKQRTLLVILSVVGLLLIISLLIMAWQRANRNKANAFLLEEIQKANAAKDKIISVISHDLRSSIGNLRNSLWLLHDDKISCNELEKLLKSYYPVAESSYDLLENLLTWASYNKDKIEARIKNLKITPLVDLAIKHTQHLSDSKNIEIKKLIDDIQVAGDANLLSSVLRNLLSNAIKFSEPNSTVIIASEQQSKMLQISVTDSGVGIKPEILSRLFIHSADYHSKGTRGEHGSGLGLWLCKSFIEKQYGTIKVESKVGEGSRFIITIPLASKPN